ncbi:MAG: peptidoglycan-binding protein [Proteobacteria bacterium]|jgi:LysM repeat protein|nr:peptidoglycan-binding protein [Pseudomonadota bacterium]MBS1224100.1 peptidoglycan-binding protein [Pseudomonadota bacterium]MBS1247343.1 peptidoglycan-binding protein [Pseudomonadota bacterium]
MNITRSSRRFRTALSLATAVLLGACAQTPPQSESTSPTPGEPPPASRSKALVAEPGAVAAPTPVALRPDHPQTYTVVPGDTLWGIAQRFLQNPWQWRDIWRQNPQIRNPNRIYPGDVLKFSYDASGKPQLEVSERAEVPLLKLSPEVRVETLTQPIPPVPRDAVESFLTRALILSEAQWKGAPYIMADDDNQVVYTDRDRVYARGAQFDQPRYQVFRPGEELREPGSGRYLGTAGVYVGEALLDQDGDPATLTLARTVAPVRAGDRLFEFEPETELYSFEPHPVPPDTEGFILANLDSDVTQITQYSSVIINLGAQEGLEPGHVLAIYGKDRQIEDPVSGGTVKVPGERSGLLMVYKVHDLVSYGLVMQAERFIRLQDRVTTP